MRRFSFRRIFVFSTLLGIIVFIDYDFLSDREAEGLGKGENSVTKGSGGKSHYLGTDNIGESSESNDETGTIEISKVEEED